MPRRVHFLHPRNKTSAPGLPDTFVSHPKQPFLVLAELFRHHATELTGFLRARKGAHDAEDLVQDGFVRLIQASAVEAPVNPRAWLYRTVSNLAADAYDHRQVRERLHVDLPCVADEFPEQPVDPARHIEARQQLRHVWTALQRLPEPCRHAFLMNRLDGMSQRAIASQLGIAEKTVERHILRAMQACRQALHSPRNR